MDQERRYFSGWRSGEVRSFYSSRLEDLDRYTLPIFGDENIIGNNVIGKNYKIDLCEELRSK
jgi:hypothetical protein